MRSLNDLELGFEKGFRDHSLRTRTAAPKPSFPYQMVDKSKAESLQELQSDDDWGFDLMPETLYS